MDISRNAPCPCGSGKKYKMCCMPKKEAPSNKVKTTQSRAEENVIAVVLDDQLNSSAFGLLGEMQNAIALKREGKFLDADNIYSRLNKENPGHKDILFNWAKVKMLLGNYEEATQMFSESARISEKCHLYHEAAICRQHIENLKFSDKESAIFINYLKEVAGNISLEIKEIRRQFEQIQAPSEEDITSYYEKVEKISAPFYNSLKKPIEIRKSKEKVRKKISNSNKVMENEPVTELSPAGDENSDTDLASLLSNNSQVFWDTAEYLYNTDLKKSIDYSCILTPYAKAIETEIYEKFLKKLEAWSISDNQEIFIGNRRIQDFSKVTLGQYHHLLNVAKIKEFIERNFDLKSIQFLLNEFGNKVKLLAQIRNPHSHKTITTRDIVDSFRKILVEEKFLMNVACLS
ncbi:MAG: SEC-C metal-binding domain-containing protein [Ignavibacteriales bacterium]